jgi:hypothetical protein
VVLRDFHDPVDGVATTHRRPPEFKNQQIPVRH